MFRGAPLCAAHLTHFPNVRVISGLAEVFPAQIVAAGAVKRVQLSASKSCARETHAHVCFSTQHMLVTNDLFIYGLLIICAATSSERERKPNAWAETAELSENAQMEI